jgi:hypothetical protein
MMCIPADWHWVGGEGETRSVTGHVARLVFQRVISSDE